MPGTRTLTVTDITGFRVLVDRPRPTAAVVTALGEVDIATVPALRQALIGAVPPTSGHLVVDVSGVTFFSAAGVGMMLDISDRTEAVGVAMHVVGVQARSPVAAVLRAAGVMKLLSVHPVPSPGPAG